MKFSFVPAEFSFRFKDILQFFDIIFLGTFEEMVKRTHIQYPSHMENNFFLAENILASDSKFVL